MIYSIVLGVCALFMFGIGLKQLKSKKPVAFYSGEKPPVAERIKDVKAWNTKHGLMWIFYGVTIVVGMIGGIVVGDSPLLVLIYCVCLLLPIIVMVLYHRKLVKEYLV